ncbi:hypothetical protein FRACYDRAFT_246390 [Fragilariopsis cylindrus CCMP1102]|uniref:Uncharacterized protein n=1 Tax=Fragilariopsis cylindrus CCMP1102 TaxID=635003 RepID=A0A1E7EZI8_9STRA|nr:hypothetical protein FRACYDRAFT_246390 [Fragilariopsis cylindrus CCMP1102]|eukprot:OEU11277.1 hypothetical protein FRACYDRAFT_246390 [Fragilariopsis cylindrus CCMP1102]
MSSSTKTQVIIPQIPQVIPDIDNVILDDNDENDNNNNNSNNNSNYKYANEILSKELLNLSFEHRNAYQEEIHGVGCMAPTETPTMIKESLRKLELELLHNISTLDCNYKQAYIQSQHLYSVYKKQYEEDHSNNATNATNGKDNTNDKQESSQSRLQPSYINSKEFRVCFLRCELFHIQKAAVRLLKYLTYVKEFFGLYALLRPIQITDFKNEELTVMRKGYIQLMPFRDRIGRRIILLFPGIGLITMNDIIRAKIMLYMSYVLACDVDTQRKGIVFLIWFDVSLQHTNNKDANQTIDPNNNDTNQTTDPNNNPNQTTTDNPNYNTTTKAAAKRIASKSKFYEAGMVRTSAFHICTPDTSIFKLKRAVWTIGIGGVRSHLKIHVGSPIELRYILHSYGIPTNNNNLPISFSGTIKTKYCKQWIRIREHQDQDQDNLILEKVSIVECPYLSDIIFRQGTNVIHHPGNSWFRSLIQTKFEEGYGNITNDDSKGNGNGNGTIVSGGNSTNTNPTTTTNSSSITYKSKRTKPLTEELIKEIKRRNCRILIWNDQEFGWWSKFDNEQQIFNKIEYICRDFIFGSNKSHCINRRQVVTSVTATSSVGLVNNKSSNKSNKSKENKEQIITQPLSSIHSNHHHPNHHPNHHHQRGGGTSILSSLQQGSLAFSSKLRRGYTLDTVDN